MAAAAAEELKAARAAERLRNQLGSVMDVGYGRHGFLPAWLGPSVIAEACQFVLGVGQCFLVHSPRHSLLA